MVECVEVHLRVRHFYNAMSVDLGSAGHVDIGAHSVPGGIWFVIHVITGGAICGRFLTRHGGVVHAISGDRHHSLFIASPHACLLLWDIIFYICSSYFRSGFLDGPSVFTLLKMQVQYIGCVGWWTYLGPVSHSISHQG